MLAYGANSCGQLGQSHINSLFAGQFDASAKKQSGNGSFDPAQHVPIIVKSLLGRHIVRIACGAHHCMALSGALMLGNFTVTCLKLGLSRSCNSRTARSACCTHRFQGGTLRTRARFGLHFSQLHHTPCIPPTLICLFLVIPDKGDLYSWGDGRSGQLGVDSQLQPTPRLVAALHSALRLAARQSAAPPANAAAYDAPAAHDRHVQVEGSNGGASAGAAVITIKKFRAETEEARLARMPADAIVDVRCGAHFAAALTGMAVCVSHEREWGRL